VPVLNYRLYNIIQKQGTPGYATGASINWGYPGNMGIDGYGCGGGGGASSGCHGGVSAGNGATSSLAATAAIANTGSGGGGGYASARPSSAGSAGVCIIKYWS
jgi:hypothetical protein